MCSIENIKQIIRNKPISFIRMTDVVIDDYASKGTFSFTTRKYHSKIFIKSSLIIVQSTDTLWLAFIKNKQPISSIDTRITLHHLQRTQWSSIDDIKQTLTNDYIRKLENYTQKDFARLSPNLSEKLLQIFASHYADFLMKHTNSNIQKSDINIMQSDAIHLAISISGMGQRDIKQIELNDKESNEISRLTHLLEDNVISYEFNEERDGLVRYCSPTGKITFANQDEKLTLYTANKLPLEQVFGVDLIYINDIHKNIVMVQYKMLRKENNQWLFRFDSQIYSEIQRMDKISNAITNVPTEGIDDFRLNSFPFFLRFVKNQSINNNFASFNISLDHFKMIENLPMCRGIRNGKIISYENMKKHYIGKNELEALIRSGYIGTHQYDTEQLSEVIKLISENSPNHSLVIAFKEKLTH